MDEPGFLARIWEFASAVADHELAAITGVVLVIEPFVESLFPSKWRERLNELLSKEKRRSYLFRLSAICLFWAAFQAFDDVNKRLRTSESLRLEAQAKLDQAASVRPTPVSGATSRLTVSRIWPHDFDSPTAGKSYGFFVDYKNDGPVSADEPVYAIQVLSGHGPYSAEDEDRSVALARQELLAKRNYEKRDRNQVYPGQGNELQIQLLAPITPEQYETNQISGTDVLMVIIFEYGDESTPAGFNRVTEFCGHLRQSGVSGWTLCHSFNRVFLSSR